MGSNLMGGAHTHVTFDKPPAIPGISKMAKTENIFYQMKE